LVITYQDFLVSKDGTPLTGLIQDHVLAGRTLTMHDRFFENHAHQNQMQQILMLMANRDVIIRHGHLLSGLIYKAYCGSTLPSLLHSYYEFYGKRYVLLLSLGLSHRRRLINQCRDQAGQKTLQKIFSLSEYSNEQILINQFAKGFCLKSFDEHQYQYQFVKQSMSNLFKQFQENNLQFLIQSGAKRLNY
ncbi:unnamed protein product, partial [Rotaria sordida]